MSLACVLVVPHPTVTVLCASGGEDGLGQPQTVRQVVLGSSIPGNSASKRGKVIAGTAANQAPTTLDPFKTPDANTIEEASTTCSSTDC